MLLGVHFGEQGFNCAAVRIEGLLHVRLDQVETLLFFSFLLLYLLDVDRGAQVSHHHNCLAGAVYFNFLLSYADDLGGKKQLGVANRAVELVLVPRRLLLGAGRLFQLDLEHGRFFVGDKHLEDLLERVDVLTDFRLADRLQHIDARFFEVHPGQGIARALFDPELLQTPLLEQEVL